MDHSSTTLCPRCGASLDNAQVEGLCARCLGALNFAPETVLPGEHVAHAPGLTPEELAPHFPHLEIVACLGRGGMGVVYKAKQKSLNRLVALKLLAPERANDPQFATRFEKEAQALASLNHPYIVGVYDFGQAGGFYYLLMEFVDGMNLRQAMSAGRLTPERSLAIVPPVCEALQYAHEHGIVHRDIKPENLLLNKEGRVKIADFGIAKMLGTDADTAARDDEQQAGTLASAAGTPQYMAPEQKAHRTADHRGDIYSLGVVLYELLTGELPADKLQPPSRKVQIDVRLDKIVLRALQTQPELRYQTAREFRTQLETVVSTHADSQSSCMFKTGQGFLYPPDQFTTASGQFYAYRTRGQLILDDRQLAHSRAGVNTIIPLATIRDVSLAQYPRTLLQPTGVDLLSVTYEEGGQRSQILLSPMEGWFGFPSDRNALTAEWFAALRDAVTSATGHEPASTPREQVGIPRGSNLTLALLLAGPRFALAVLWGCLIYIAIMRQTPGAPTTFPFNINPLGVVFALLFLYGLIAGGLSWLGHRRARKASLSAAQWRKKFDFARSVALVFLLTSVFIGFFGKKYYDWRWEKTHWHSTRMQWGGDSPKDAAGVLRFVEVKREGRIVIFRIACESGQMPVNFQVSYSGQELESLPSADAVFSVTPLYMPTSASTPLSPYAGKTLIGEQWEQRMDKITLAKPGEFTLGFVLPDEVRAEMALQQAWDMYPPGRPCHLAKSAVLVLFLQQRNEREKNWEQLQAVLNVDFAAAP